MQACNTACLLRTWADWKNARDVDDNIQTWRAAVVYRHASHRDERASTLMARGCHAWLTACGHTCCSLLRTWTPWR